MKESTLYQAIFREGREEGLETVARNLLRMGRSVEQVRTATGLSLERLQELNVEVKTIVLRKL